MHPLRGQRGVLQRHCHPVPGQPVLADWCGQLHGLRVQPGVLPGGEPHCCADVPAVLAGLLLPGGREQAPVQHPDDLEHAGHLLVGVLLRGQLHGHLEPDVPGLREPLLLHAGHAAHVTPVLGAG